MGRIIQDKCWITVSVQRLVSEAYFHSVSLLVSTTLIQTHPTQSLHQIDLMPCCKGFTGLYIVLKKSTRKQTEDIVHNIFYTNV